MEGYAKSGADLILIDAQTQLHHRHRYHQNKLHGENQNNNDNNTNKNQSSPVNPEFDGDDYPLFSSNNNSDQNALLQLQLQSPSQNRKLSPKSSAKFSETGGDAAHHLHHQHLSKTTSE